MGDLGLGNLFGPIVQMQSLEHHYLDNAVLDDDTIPNLSEWIGKLSRPQTLSLGVNRLGAEGIKALAVQFSGLTHLTELKFGESYYADQPGA